MHVHGKFFALVLDPSISYSTHTCVYMYNFHYYYGIDPFSPPIRKKAERTIQKEVEISVMFLIFVFAGLSDSYYFRVCLECETFCYLLL